MHINTCTYTQMYCPLSSSLRISITAVNIDVEGGNVERESQEASITVITEPVGPPQVPDRPSVISITNTNATVTWNDPGRDVMCVIEWGSSLVCMNAPSSLTR